MSGRICGLVFDNGPMERDMRFVLLAIGERADRNGFAFPLIQDIARRTLFTREYVSKTLRKLVAEKWVEICEHPSNYKSKAYKLNMEKLSCEQSSREEVESHVNCIDSHVNSVGFSCEQSSQPPHPLIGVTVNEPSLTPKKKITAEEIYKAYPRRVGHGAAIKKIQLAMKRYDPEMLLAQTVSYAKKRTGEDPQFTPHPATWFFQERFLDEDLSPQPRYVEVPWEESGFTFDRERNAWVDREGRPA